MQQVLGYSALQGGFAWAVSGVASMLFAGISQMLVTKGSAKLVMAFGMTVLGAGILWTAQAPVHGSYMADLFGPFLLAVGMGTSFGFIPIAIAALTGRSVTRTTHTSSDRPGVAASHFNTLTRGGDTVRVALTGGFHAALWVSAVIALCGIPLTFLLVRRDELSDAVAKTTISEPQPALAGAD